MKLNNNTIKKISFTVNEKRVIKGFIELASTQKIHLNGKLEIINNNDLVSDWFVQENLDKKLFKFPMSFSLICTETKAPDNNFKNDVVKFLDFWKDAKVFWTNLDLYLEQKLIIRFTGAIGKTYSSNHKSADIDIQIELKKAKILESKNVPSLKDVTPVNTKS